MDVTAIAIAVVVVGLLVWFVSSRSKPKLPADADETPALPAAEPTPEPRKAAAQAEPAPTPADAPPAQPDTAEAEPAEALQAEAAPTAALEAAEQPVPAAPPAPSDDEAEREAREKEVAALRKGLASTRSGFISRLAKLFGGQREIDTELLEEIEEVLITADIGVKTADRILGELRKQMQDGLLGDEDAVWESLRNQATAILHVDAPPINVEHRPSLILVVGVNGVGKTTTIGKLASRYRAEGKKVLLAAADTYRAAAVLQLEVWGRRVDCPVVRGKDGADPGSVIFDAIKRANDEGYDLVIADTAGRLHTKVPLMEELKKVERTCEKALGGRPADEVLLVLDSTTGQNAVQQMTTFKQVLNRISGLVITKLDGTAKGGVILGIVDEHKVPVRFIGLGERVEDLREFDSRNFVQALFEKPGDETLAA